MGIFLQNKNKIITGICLAMMLVLIVNSDVLVGSVNNAISVFFNNVFPILFPFIVLANIITDALFSKVYCNKYFHFLLSSIGGYPLCANILSNLTLKNAISKEEQLNVLTLSFVTSPGFIIGTVGFSFLNDKRAGVIILVGHYISALLNSLFYSPKNSSKPKTIESACSSFDLKKFTQILFNALKTMAIVLSYIIIFMIITDLLELFFLSSFSFNPWVDSCIKGVFEVTIGTSQLSLCNIPKDLKLALLSGIISFGGLSVIFQASSILSNTQVSLKDVLKIKIGHGILAFLVTYFLTFILTTFVIK